MDELKHLTNPNSVLQLSNILRKISTSIERQKVAETTKESEIKEIDFLREQCLSTNPQLSLLSCQTLYRLVEDLILQPANVLTMFISMLSNASTSAQYTAISEGIINLLLLDLKERTAQINVPYVCLFGLKSPQHPMIALIQKKNSNITDLANKINGICNHHDKQIRQSSIEFLRPVFTYVFCNPLVKPDSKSIWMCFLSQIGKSNKALELLYELFCWSRIASSTACLHQTILLTESIEYLLNLNEFTAAVDFQIYLVALLLTINDHCYDPRSALSTILRTLKECNNELFDSHYYNYLLITFAELLHVISPFYLIDVLRPIKFLLVKEDHGNIISQAMILDGLIVRLGSANKSIPTNTVIEMEDLIKLIKKKNGKTSKPSKLTNNLNVKYFHPKIALNYNLVILSEQLCETGTNIDWLNILSNQKFCSENHYFLRGVLLCEKNCVDSSTWLMILACLAAIVKENIDVSTDMIYFVLFLLAKEIDGEKQLALLRALNHFASVKENIPLILNTYRALSSSRLISLKTLSIDLYARLWHTENRTYQFLHQIISPANEMPMSVSDQWEMNITKANAIKQICLTKASQHGTELVGPLSIILNNCANNKNDLATSLALDAIVLLCNSHTVNVTSTWKALKNMFKSEKRLRAVKSLCKFFAEVPLLRSPTDEYESLYYESLEQLWSYVTDFDSAPIITTALNALQNFDFTELSVKHVPSIYWDNIKIPNEYQKLIIASINDTTRDNLPLTAADVLPYIPGECCIELLEKVNQNAVDAAIDLITHLIECEISGYRSGVYMLPEGRSEPNELQHLHARSPLKAITKYLRTQSTAMDNISTVLLCLNCLKQKYSRPIPPLNWFFLIEFINGNNQVNQSNYDELLQLKKYALTIASHQVAHSGSARNLIENYLQQFDVASRADDEIQMIMKLTPIMCNGIAPRIIANFLNETLAFLFNKSKSSNFEINCDFEQAVEAISAISLDNCLIAENIDIIVDELLKYDRLLEADHKIYEKYSRLLSKLSNETLDRLSTPATWNLTNFKKTFILRSNLVSAKKPFVTTKNSLMWLNLLIDNSCNNSDSNADREQKDLILGKISKSIRHWNNDNEICDWTMFLMGKTLALLSAEVNSNNISTAHFSLDIFLCNIVLASGCDVIDGELNLENRKNWINRFPEALWLLSERDHWNENLIRIFEFLYHLNTQQTNLPEEYVTNACNALVCLRNHYYFFEKSNWMKYIGLRK